MARQIDPKIVNLWTARAIPIVLIGVVGYATYVLVVQLCVNYLLNGPSRRSGIATVLLIIYFLLLLSMSTTYFRTLYIVIFDPGYIPLGRPAKSFKSSSRRRHHTNTSKFKIPHGNSPQTSTIASSKYTAQSPENKEKDVKERINWHTASDSPGLEQFYTKDVFVCEQDGRPRWCTDCGNWKPDRAHHCSDVGRCVRKMDHFCPWVGGVVGENSFKFFIQFVAYTVVYCAFLLVVMAIYLNEQLNTPDMTYDPHIAAILGLATFFGLFTFGMTCSSVHFALTNLTTIENLNRWTKAWQLAVYIPDREKPPTMGVIGAPFPTITYPLPLASEKASTSSNPSESPNGEAIEPEHNNTDLAHHAERDAKAKRTFAILRMEPGRNPWDLGPVGNWKTVMGNNVLDWFLPIRRSPLCNHESEISQFVLGKDFEKLKADNSLALESDPRSSSGRKTRHHSYRGSGDIKLQKHTEPP